MNAKDVVFLDNLKNRIDKMTKIQHIEILKILTNDRKIKINENKSGVYVNLSLLSEDAISKINEYVEYVSDQESILNPVENQKQQFRNLFFCER
jgi:hypothetical protein